jgi:hypothetical protein
VEQGWLKDGTYPLLDTAARLAGKIHLRASMSSPGFGTAAGYWDQRSEVIEIVVDPDKGTTSIQVLPRAKAASWPSGE